MNKDPGKSRIGEIFQELYECEAITWKIPVTGREMKNRTNMQCSSFSFRNASWVLKIFLSDGWEDDVSGRLGTVIQMERLDSKIPEHIFTCRSFMKKHNEETSDFHAFVKFNSRQRKNVIVDELNWHSMYFDDTKEYTITLVVEILTVKNDVNLLNSQLILPVSRFGIISKFFHTDSYHEFIMSTESNISEIGEISQESYEFEAILWKVPLSSQEIKNGAKMQCSPFTCRNALWVLKVFFSDCLEDNVKGTIIQMERLDSKIPEHIFSCRSFVKNDYTITRYSPVPVKFNSNQRENTIVKFNYRKGKLSLSFIVDILSKESGATVSDFKSFPTQSTLDKHCTSASSIVFRENKIFHDFKDFFRKKENCDVILKVQGQEFPAHKAILEARSPVLASTFRNDMKETGVVNIEDCDPSSFSDFLCFLYCGDTDVVSKGNVISLFTAADKYDVQDLREMCLEFMKKNLSVDTFCETIHLGLRHSEEQLIKLATDFFIENAKEITLTAKWQSFLAENPTASNELIVKFIASK